MTLDLRTSMKKTVIIVPASHAGILEIGQDCASLGQNDFVIEKIGEPFRDNHDGSCKYLKTWWPGTDLNRRRQPFQGCLPTMLSGSESAQALVIKAVIRVRL